MGVCVVARAARENLCEKRERSLQWVRFNVETVRRCCEEELHGEILEPLRPKEKKSATNAMAGFRGRCAHRSLCVALGSATARERATCASEGQSEQRQERGNHVGSFNSCVNGREGAARSTEAWSSRAPGRSTVMMLESDAGWMDDVALDGA